MYQVVRIELGWYVILTATDIMYLCYIDIVGRSNLVIINVLVIELGLYIISGGSLVMMIQAFVLYFY